MKKQITSLGIIFCSLALSLISSAQTTETSFNFSGQLRPRFELRDGNFRPADKGDQPAVLISDRLRLTLEYNYGNRVTIKVVPQVVSIWGQSHMVQGPTDHGSQFAVDEAYGQFNLNPTSNLRFGRQAYSLDQERFMGKLDWAQGGRAFDGVSYQVDAKKLSFKSLLVYNQNYNEFYNNNLNNPKGNLYSTEDAYPFKWMQTAWASTPIGKTGKVSGLITNLGFQNQHSAADTGVVNWQQTFGLTYLQNGKNLNARLEAYFQSGKNAGGTNTSAYMLALGLGKQFSQTLDIEIGAEYLSGQEIGSSATTTKVFTPYFGTNHKFYGSMDYFYAGSGHSNVGLNDNYLKVNIKPSNSLNLQFAIHQFFSPSELKTTAKTYSKNLGQEFDLTVNWKINPIASFIGGYSGFFTKESLRYIKGTPTATNYQQWVWAGLNFTPQFFKSKN